MIAQLEGMVKEIRGNSVILLVNGVGYKVRVTAQCAVKLRESDKKTVILRTHLAVRETSMDLYGFLDLEELKFFEMLISISGIGPKSALAILSIADTDTLKTAISAGDSSYLTKVSGIGKKNAEKIVLELRDKLDSGQETRDGAILKGEMDAIDALQALGYSARQAREALKQVSEKTEGTNNRLKEALKILGK
jgi:holliday junction DNA helicase RuvA